MELVAIVEPSSGTNPGHMVIGQEAVGAEPRFFGFRFDPNSLPDEFQSPDRWQEYFYSKKTLGSIHDETLYVRNLRKRNPDDCCEKRVVCDVLLESTLPPEPNWKHFAYYSFRPDDFNSDAEPCYNCVTWAIMIASKLVPGFLLPVSQGRIKFILRQLRAAAANSGESNG